MRRRIVPFLCIGVVLGASFCASGTALAAPVTRTFTPTGTSNGWSYGPNWTPAGVPETGDNVIIPQLPGYSTYFDIPGVDLHDLTVATPFYVTGPETITLEGDLRVLRGPDLPPFSPELFTTVPVAFGAGQH